MSRTEGDPIARLLDEIQASAGPSTWQRVEELVHRLTALYGDALGRVLALARDGAPDPALDGRLCADELVASVLLLHGLHPLPCQERVARAAREVADRLGPGVSVEVVAIGEDGLARVRVEGLAASCGSATGAIARGIEHAILEAAPELSGVSVEGVALPAEPERLVTLGLGRTREEVGSR